MPDSCAEEALIGAPAAPAHAPARHAILCACRLPRSVTPARRFRAPWQARCRFGLDEAAAVRETSDSEIVCALPRSTQPRDQHRSPVLYPELPPQHVAVSLDEGATWSAHEVCVRVSL